MKIYASQNNMYDILSQFVGQDIWVRIGYGKGQNYPTYDYFVKLIDIDDEFCTGYAARCNFSYNDDGTLFAEYDLNKSLSYTNTWKLQYISIFEPLELYTTDELFGEIHDPHHIN